MGLISHRASVASNLCSLIEGHDDTAAASQPAKKILLLAYQGTKWLDSVMD
jgi:hypothetical protein